MPFPEVERIIFDANPLTEVVCQFNFIGPMFDNLLLDTIAQNLHNDLGSEYGLQQFKKQKSHDVFIDEDKGIIKTQEKPTYVLESLNGMKRVIFTADFISVVTADYQNKNEFFNLVEATVMSVKKAKFIPPLKRVGLKYRDVIQRSKLQSIDTETDWVELLNNALVGAFNECNISKSIKGCNSNLRIELVDMPLNGMMLANYGTVIHDDSGEECFLIDSDIYAEGIFDYNNAKTFLDAANIKARNFFRWCMTDKLYQSLKPRSEHD